MMLRTDSCRPCFRRSVALESRSTCEPKALHFIRLCCFARKPSLATGDSRQSLKHRSRPSGQGCAHVWHQQAPCFGGQLQAYGLRQRRGIVAQQHFGDECEGANLACKPAAGVEAGQQVQRPLRSDAAVAGPQGFGRRRMSAAGAVSALALQGVACILSARTTPASVKPRCAT